MKNHTISNAAKTSIYSKLYLVLTVLVLCLFLFPVLSERFFRVESESALRIEEFQREIQELCLHYQAKNHAAYEIFHRKIQTAGADDFRIAEQNVKRTVKKISSFKTSVKLIQMMICDKAKKTDSARQYMNELIFPLIISPCAKGSAEINDVLKIFQLQVQENDNQFHAECAKKLQELPAPDRKAATDFINNLNKFHKQTGDMMAARLFTAIGSGIEIILIRQTFSAFANLTGKIAAKAGASAVLPFVDGPIPIGDILAVAGAGWAAADLYIVLKVMPEKLEKNLYQMIRNCENDMRKAAITQAQSVCNMSKQNMESVTKQIQENK